jgi:hypothetical protein
VRAAAALLVVAACGGAPAPAPAPAPARPAAEAAPVEIVLEPGVETPIPGTDLAITLGRVTPYQPREELPQDRGFVEHEPESAYVQLRRGDLTDMARWREGENDELPGWQMTIDGERVVLTRR